MISPLIANTKHPKRAFTGITQLGLTAFNLATLHKALLDPRLPVGTVDGLGEDLVTLGVIVPGTKQAHDEARVATGEQDQAARKGYAKIRSIRAAVRKVNAPIDVQSAYGVGAAINPRITRDVKAGLQQIVDRATAKPAEAAALGILQKDVDAMKAARQTLMNADTTQETKRAMVPLSTQERNRTANRILLAVGRIAAAGGIEFADAPATLKSFAALKVTPKKKIKAEPETVAPAPTEEQDETPAPTDPSDV